MVLDNTDDMQLFFGSPVAASSLAGVSQAGPGRFSDYIPECRHRSLLVTTRNKQLGVRLAKGRQPVEVSCINKDKSEQLLLATLGNIGATTTELSLLSSQLEHLPLALVQAAAFIQETCITVAKYLQLLSESDKNIVRLLSKEFETVGRDSSNPKPWPKHRFSRSSRLSGSTFWQVSFSRL
uniref:NB-ARC domain-containing protein n=1 Tax=Bionectria ochroleuca TaxID=29856 RepID=A0A8H7NHM7_BIOOC